MDLLNKLSFLIIVVFFNELKFAYKNIIEISKYKILLIKK